MPNINNKQSIRLITKVLIDAAVDKIKGEYILKIIYLARSIEILKGYIGNEDAEDLQLESIFAIQLLSNELEHPSGKPSNQIVHKQLWIKIAWEN